MQMPRRRKTKRDEMCPWIDITIKLMQLTMVKPCYKENHRRPCIFHTAWYSAWDENMHNRGNMEMKSDEALCGLALRKRLKHLDKVRWHASKRAHILETSSHEESLSPTATPTPATQYEAAASVLLLFSSLLLAKLRSIFSHKPCGMRNGNLHPSRSASHHFQRGRGA